MNRQSFSNYAVSLTVGLLGLVGTSTVLADTSELGFKDNYKYEKISFDDKGTSDGFFSFDDNAVAYIAPHGYQNVLEFVLNDVEAAGYVNVEAIYRYAERYVLVVSTGENGMSCPATTYLFTLNTRSNDVDQKAEVAGCSEDVVVQANDTTLVAQKESEAKTVVERGKLVK